MPNDWFTKTGGRPSMGVLRPTSTDWDSPNENLPRLHCFAILRRGSHGGENRTLGKVDLGLRPCIKASAQCQSTRTCGEESPKPILAMDCTWGNNLLMPINRITKLDIKNSRDPEILNAKCHNMKLAFLKCNTSVPGVMEYRWWASHYIKKG